jgi:hypothetical protein
MNPGQNMLVERNTFRDNTKCGFTLSGHNWATVAKNNLSYHNLGCGLSINSSGGGGHKVYANTLMHNSSVGLQVLDHGDNATIKNNLYDRFSVDDAALNVTLSNNYDACPTCTQPSFRDVNNSDYRPLPSDTALVGQGANLTSVGVTKDFDDNARPDAAQTIGAFEVASGDPTPFDYLLSPDVVEEETPQVAQGDTVDIDIVVTELSGTAAAVVFSAQNLPPQTVASFLPMSCSPSGGTCTTTMTLDTANGTPDASYQVRVLGTSGVTVRTTEVPVQVNCATP